MHGTASCSVQVVTVPACVKVWMESFLKYILLTVYALVSPSGDDALPFRGRITPSWTTLMACAVRDVVGDVSKFFDTHVSGRFTDALPRKVPGPGRRGPSVLCSALTVREHVRCSYHQRTVRAQYIQ